MTHWMQIKTISQAETPCPRWGHAMCSVRDSLYLFGGYESSKYFNDLWKFNLHTLKFSQIQQLGQIPPPCSNFTMNLNQDQSKIILFGGGTLNKEKLNSVYEYNIATSTWKKLLANDDQPKPWNRSYHCSEIIENYLVVFGGEFFHDLDDLWLFDLEKYTWIEVKLKQTDLKPKGRKFASSFQYKNRFYIIGGCHSKYESLCDAYYLDLSNFLQSKQLDQVKWRQLKLNKSEVINRWGHVSVVKNAKAYIFGGRQGSKDLQNLIAIDLVAQRCDEICIVGDLPKGRRKPGLCLRNNTLFCHSGFDGSYVKDFLQINLLTKPKYNQKQQLQGEYHFEQLGTQKIERIQENLEIIYDNNVLKLSNAEENDKLRKNLPQFAASLTTKQFSSFFNQSKALKDNQYFQVLINGPFIQEELKIHRPQDTTQRQYFEMVEVFLLYLRYGKIFLSQLSVQESNKLIENLLELSNYYGIHHLGHIIKQWLLSNFQKNLMSKKGQIKRLVETSYTLERYDSQLGQYAGFNSLLKLIKVSNILKIDELKLKLKKMTHINQVAWLMELIKKFEFQLQQQVLNKAKVQSQNDIPQLNEWNSNQKASATPNRCLNFFGIL